MAYTTTAAAPGIAATRHGEETLAQCTPLYGGDPDSLATMLRPIQGELLVTERGAFSSNVVRIDLDRLWMQHVDEKLSRIWHTASSATRAAIWFFTKPGPAVIYQGADVHVGDVGICRIGEPIWQRLTGPTSWGSMSLSFDDWEQLVSSVAGYDPFSSSGGLILSPRAPDIARLQRLHRSTARLARDAPELLDDIPVARGIEQSLIHAMIQCLEPPWRQEFDVPARRRTKIMQKFREYLQECADEPIYIPELCARLGVPDRTLRLVCHEFLGIGPKRYLHLRRMNLARRALCSDDAVATSITEVAMRFGFWELGRFSVAYKAIFGESPSRTLLRRSGSTLGVPFS